MGLAAVIVTAALSGPAHAVQLALDPQNRVHAGLSVADGDNIGGTIGLDSRLTRLIYVDVGGFLSGMPPADVELTAAAAEQFSLRHALYVSPGLRIPHRYRDGVNWDFTGRVGFASVWASDASQEFDVQVDPSLMGGADLLLRYDSVGLRCTGRAFGFRPFSATERIEIPMIRPQWAVEAVYQW